jgi:HD domain-containing protein
MRAAIGAYVDMLPVTAVMLTLAAATVALTGALGVLAIGVFALIAILPQSFLTYAARTRPVARLDPDTATARYGHAIAVHLGLSRAERQHFAAVARAARARPPSGEAIDYVEATALDARLAMCDAQLVSEWWNGGGGPFGLRGGQIPWAARVLAVAHTWSALTARGGPELGHREAMEHLRETAGVRLDPTVVRAARAVVGQELVSAQEPAPEPRLHNLRIPAPLRRALSASAAPGDLLGG